MRNRFYSSLLALSWLASVLIAVMALYLLAAIGATLPLVYTYAYIVILFVLAALTAFHLLRKPARA